MSKTRHTDLMPPEIVVDDVLSLRRLVPDDAETLFQIIQDDPTIKQGVTWAGMVSTLEDAQRCAKDLLQEDKSPYVLQEHGVTIGYASTWAVATKEHEIGFSYFLAKDKRGHGYVTRATEELMRTVKQNLPAIDTFILNITDANTPSQAVAARLGFKATDKLLRDRVLPDLTRRHERPA